MSVINIPEAKNGLEYDQSTIQNLLIENGQLIETAADYQRMGRIKESLKYQELLHKNLIYLAKITDSVCGSQILQDVASISSPQQLNVNPITNPTVSGEKDDNRATTATANHTSPTQSQQQQNHASLPALQQQQSIQPAALVNTQSQQHLTQFQQQQQQQAQRANATMPLNTLVYGTQPVPSQSHQIPVYGYSGQGQHYPGPSAYIPPQLQANMYPQQHQNLANPPHHPPSHYPQAGNPPAVYTTHDPNVYVHQQQQQKK